MRRTGLLLHAIFVDLFKPPSDSLSLHIIIVCLNLLTHFILVDFLRHVDTISMELPTLYCKGSQVEIAKL